MSNILALGILLAILLFVVTIFKIFKLGFEMEKSFYDDSCTPFTKADMKYLDSLDKHTIK